MMGRWLNESNFFLRIALELAKSSFEFMHTIDFLYGF